MEAVSIRVYVSREAAIRANRVGYGATEYHPTPDELAALSDAQREELARDVRFEVEVEEVSWDHIVSRLDARLERRAKDEQREADKAARLRQEWEKWLGWAESVPDEELLTPVDHHYRKRLPGWDRPEDEGQCLRYQAVDGRMVALRKAEEAKQAAAHEEAVRRETEQKAKHIAERAAWVEQHGSQRLRLMLEQGYPLAETYRNERLAAERPGYRWAVEVCGSPDDIRDPSLEALLLLGEEQQSDPDAKLAWWGGDHYPDCDCDSGGREVPGRAVVMAKFLGRKIMRDVDQI